MDYYRNLAKIAGIPEGQRTEEFLFTVEMVNYFYYKKILGNKILGKDLLMALVMAALTI